MPVWKCKRDVPASEFFSWVEYFIQEEFDVRRQDYFLARIAYEVAVTRYYLGRNKTALRKLKFDDFLHFVKRRFAQQKSKDPAIQLRDSKTFWLAGLGLLGKHGRRSHTTTPESIS